jgi:5-methylcytosine-specific restriction protein B
MNIDDFKEYLQKKGHSQATLSTYPLMLTRDIPQYMKNFDKNFPDTILEITELDKLEDLYNRCLKGDLQEFNANTQNRAPSASLGKYIEFLKSINYGQINDIENIQISNNSESIKTRNIMLYGAPGVGKTHNYKRLITMIENGEDEKTIFNTISKNETTEQFDDVTFETIKKDKRIEFVTFHQSYSYEDFIEGFRPSEEDEKIVRQDGIFKIISDKAKNNLEDSKKNVKQLNEEKTLYQKFQEYVNDRIQNNKKLKLQRGEEFYFNRFEENRLYFKASEKSNVNDEFNLKYDDFVSIKGSLAPKQTLRDISNILGTNSVQQKYAYYLQIYYDFVDYVDEYHILNGEESKEVKKVEQKNFYIVIDEINRGNISKIFGELITLIEEDKRGKKEYEVTLPYSKAPFLVPENLYIIATMNSTDKSIATIDIALRRRFTFLKMKPNKELVKHEKAKELMDKLNKYIEKERGEDYKLGHSYFMNIIDDKDLEFVKEYKIKPLLEEYFYGDEKNYKQAVAIVDNDKKVDNQ